MKFLWTTLTVSDLNRSLAFYRDALGLPVISTMSNPQVEIAFLGAGETQLELIQRKPAGVVTPTSDVSLGFEVGPLEAHIATLAAKGVPVDSGPFAPGPHIRFYYVKDPDGFEIQFVERPQGK